MLSAKDEIELEAVTEHQFNVYHNESSVQGIENTVQEGENTVHRLSKTVQDAVQDCLWQFKSLEKTVKERPWTHFMNVLTGGVAVVAICMSLLHTGIIMQAECYLVFLGLFVAHDPLQIFCRWLARETRIIFLANIILLMATIGTFDVYFLFVLCISVAISYFICHNLNKRWLISDNWKMTRFVEKAMLGTLRDADGSWQGHGRRECRTLLHELGYSVDDDTLDLYIKPVYCLAHTHGINKSPDSIKKEYDELLDDYNKLVDENNQMYEELQLSNSQIERVQEDIKQQEIADQVLQLREDGLSIRKIADQLEIKKGQVEKILREN